MQDRVASSHLPWEICPLNSRKICPRARPSPWQAPCYDLTRMRSGAASALTVVILAAGDSKRMKSSRPKVLHPLCGRPLIHYPVAVARALGGKVVLVVGRASEQVRTVVSEAPDLVFVEQKERRGTGH